MPWIVNREKKEIIFLEDEAAPLLKYGGYEDYPWVETAEDIADSLNNMDDEYYEYAIQDCCGDMTQYIDDYIRDVEELTIVESEYRDARSLLLDIAEALEEILMARGMVKYTLVPTFKPRD